MTDYLPFLAVMAPIALFWQQSKAIFKNLLNIFWKTKQMEGVAGIEFYRFLSRYRHYDFDNYRIHYWHVYDKEGNQVRQYTQDNYKELYFYKGFIPVIVTNKRGDIAVSYFNLTFPFKKLFLKHVSKVPDRVTNHYVSEVKGNYKSRNTRGELVRNSPDSTSSSPPGASSEHVVLYGISVIGNKVGYMLDGSNVADYSYSINNPNMNKYIYTDEGNYVKEVVTKWKQAEHWYLSKGIRYYRSILLHGAPGTGKSALIFEIAKDLDLPIFVFDLSSMDNTDLSDRLKELRDVKGIILFEDIDCNWCGRENLNKTEFGGLTFDCFLNKLSGVDAVSNKFVFMTTNNIQDLDEAMIRSGRCDEILELKPLTHKEKILLAQKILEKDFDFIVEDATLHNTSDFENACVAEALRRYWNAGK